jgi:hypothetical protein
MVHWVVVIAVAMVGTVLLAEFFVAFVVSMLHQYSLAIVAALNVALLMVVLALTYLAITRGWTVQLVAWMAGHS